MINAGVMVRLAVRVNNGPWVAVIVADALPGPWSPNVDPMKLTDVAPFGIVALL